MGRMRAAVVVLAATADGTFWSPPDEIVNPDDSVILSGATSTRVGCIGDMGLLSDSNVYPLLRDFVR